MSLVIKDRLVDFFYPKRCLGCGRIGSFVCLNCEEKLPFLEDQFCAVCNRPSVGGFTHYRCRGLYKPDRFLCLWHYQDLGQALVRSLKYEGVVALAEPLANYLTDFLEENSIFLGEEALVTFVPLHPLKLLERGYNQTEKLAATLAQKLGLKLIPLLQKFKETRSQTTLKRDERLKNVADSFALETKCSPEIAGKDVLLLDDVFTTGATLLECANVLKRGGVRFLYLLTLAKD